MQMTMRTPPGALVEAVRSHVSSRLLHRLPAAIPNEQKARQSHTIALEWAAAVLSCHKRVPALYLQDESHWVGTAAALDRLVLPLSDTMTNFSLVTLPAPWFIPDHWFLRRRNVSHTCQAP